MTNPVTIPPDWLKPGTVVPVTPENFGLLLQALQASQKPDDGLLWKSFSALNHAYARIDDLTEGGISQEDKEALNPALRDLRKALWPDTHG